MIIPSNETNHILIPSLGEILKCVEEKTYDLSPFPHWRKLFDQGHISQDELMEPTYLLGGAFYNFCTPAPSREILSRAIQKARCQKATQLLIPNVRESLKDHDLEKIGFRKLPGDFESATTLTCPFWETLRERVGSKKLRDLKRLTVKSDQCFTFHAYEGERAYSALRDVNDLHGFHQRKHNNKMNIFSTPVLKYWMRSPLQNRMIIILRKTDQGDTAQCLVLFKSSKNSLCFLTQAKNTSMCLEGHNLYTSAFMKVYEYALNRGIKKVYLGRGGEATKAKLGANLFWQQNHWLYPLQTYN